MVINMEYTILILLLPLLSFLVLGLGGKWMSHRTAGSIGTGCVGCGERCSPTSPQYSISLLPGWQTAHTPH